MSIRKVEIVDLDESAAGIFDGRCVVAITCDECDTEWADNAVWSIARAAASTGRRTALVDLNLNDPRLHSGANKPKDTGIVDAFLFGASLQHVASQEDDPNLHFIGVGTPTPEPEKVWASDRWERLVRGFKKNKAILLLYLPPAALDTLAFTPDLILAITAQGYGSSGPHRPQLRTAIDSGLPLVEICDTPDAATLVESRKTENARPPEEKQTGLPSKTLLVALSVVVTVIVAVVFVVLNPGNENRTPDEQAVGVQQPIDSSSTVAQQTPEPVYGTEDTGSVSEDSVIPEETVGQSTVDSAPPPEADPLPYSIQVSAWTQLSQAHVHLDQFEGAGVPATITVVPRDSSGHWYRVFVGAANDYSSAYALRDRLRSDGLIGSTTGVLLNTPLALLLETHPDTLSGREAARGLRESGVPAYIVSMPDGSAQVLVGAFESPDQADLIDLVFPETDRDLSGTLVTRVGNAQ